MIRIKTKLVLSLILLIIALESFAQLQPRSPAPTESSNHTQEQINVGDPITENAKQENPVPPVETKSSESIAKIDRTDTNTNKENQSNGFIEECSKAFKTGISGNSDLPAILLGIVVAYLTILISVAIAIFSEKKAFEALDRNVILDHIINAKRLLFYLGLTFFPLLFWNGLLSWVRSLGIILWIIGMIFITRILINSYHWMKGNKFRLRFNYLRGLRNRQDMEEAWHSVWQTENINYQNEQEFFNIFHSTIDRIFKNDENNLIFGSKLLGDFDNFINERSTVFLTWSDKTLGSVLQWHFEVWKKENEYLSIDKYIDKWSMYSQLSRTMDSIFQQIAILSLRERRTYSFFNKLKEHAEKYEKVSVSSRSYDEYLFDSFYKVFFENIYDAPEKFDIWEHYFPKEWKITKGNLQNSENIISKISLNKFMEWASSRIWEEREENDFPLDDVSRNLFPNVDPILWASILIFIYSSYGDDRLRSVIERPWNFGFVGRFKVFSGSQKEDMGKDNNNDVSNTLDLSFFLFKEQFSKGNLGKYINSLERLSYPEDSKEERKRLRLYNLFYKMLDLLNGSESSDFESAS